jgi:hypothetical protein
MRTRIANWLRALAAWIAPEVPPLEALIAGELYLQAEAARAGDERAWAYHASLAMALMRERHRLAGSPLIKN